MFSNGGSVRSRGVIDNSQQRALEALQRIALLYAIEAEGNRSRSRWRQRQLDFGLPSGQYEFDGIPQCIRDGVNLGTKAASERPNASFSALLFSE